MMPSDMLHSAGGRVSHELQKAYVPCRLLQQLVRRYRFSSTGSSWSGVSSNMSV